MNSNDYLQNFSDHLINQQRSPITVSGYKGDVSLFIRWHEQTYETTFDPNDLTDTVIRAYKQYLQDNEIKPQTVKRRLASLASFAFWAQQSGCMKPGPNPVQGIKVSKQVVLAPRWLDARERARLLRTVDDLVNRAMTRFPRMRLMVLRDATIIRVLLNTGIRVSELAALRLTDLSLEDNRGLLIVREGKGSKRREIPLNAEARQALRAYLELRPHLPIMQIFIGKGGEAMDKRSAQRAVSHFANAAGLTGVSCHTLRHTFAKSLIDRGISLEKVAALMGHANLNTTQLYILPGRSDLQRAVESLDVTQHNPE